MQWTSRIATYAAKALIFTSEKGIWREPDGLLAPKRTKRIADLELVSHEMEHHKLDRNGKDVRTMKCAIKEQQKRMLRERCWLVVGDGRKRSTHKFHASHRVVQFVGLFGCLRRGAYAQTLPCQEPDRSGRGLCEDCILTVKRH